jgi:hypothetical protein
MRSLTSVALGLLCFGAGWWIDSRWDDNAGVVERDRRIPATREKKSPPREEAEPAEETVGGEKVRAKTLEELLQLTKNVPYSTGRARAEIAIRQLTAAELAAVAAEMRTLFKKPGAFAASWFQIRDPFLRRWLALDPLPALAFAGDFVGIVGLVHEDTDVAKPFHEAVRRVFLTGYEPVARILARSPSLYSHVREDCLEVMKSLPPEEALTRIMALDAKTGYNQNDTGSLGEIPSQWVESDPRQAMNWALALPRGNMRRHILHEMANAWGQRNQEEAMAFLKQTPLALLPAGQLRESLESVAKRTPEE